ncbi:Ig-like domain-containing protein [Paenibacillus gallinarum]|uniref:Ig-like domain-containing protein n=1 Tax=Paenibacillus gallinarum TaxID=2762232 RepID=A0ABR8SYQ2_9BACL|nr:Ig-like domain-containing protein [Paenibacillus gallinarum]MBD7968630.1 Ig-like domain-containing protein [Paenibacillus gallinarum]
MIKQRLAKVMAAFMALVLVMTTTGLVSVNVVSAADAEISKLVLSTDSLSLEIGDSSTLTATAVYKDGKSNNVTISTNWTSNDSPIASVYNGTITAKGEGTATIVAAFDGESQAVNVKVTKKVKALTKDKQVLDLRTGQEASVVLKAIYTDNTEQDVSSIAEWTSSDNKVATVVNGSVNALSAGTAIVTAKLGKQSVTIEVGVEVVRRIEMDYTQLSLLLKDGKLKDEQKVILTATYPDGETKDVTADAVWSSSNEKVADAFKGNIVAYKAGTATISAEYGTKTTTLEVDVDKTRKLVASEQSFFMKLNETKQINLEAVYPDDSKDDVTTKAVWSSSNEKIADVIDGKVYANASGSVTITAKYSNQTVEIPVDVEVARHLDIDKEELGLKVGGTHTFKVLAAFANGVTEEVTNKATWTSSEESVAFVESGNLTAYKSGKTTVKATYGGKTVEVAVSVDIPTKVALANKKGVVPVDGTLQANVIATYAEDREEIVTDKAEWSSSNEKIAEVTSGGLITGIKTGKATITAKYQGKTLTMAVEVGLASGLQADVPIVALLSKETYQLKLTASDEYGNEQDVSNDATWKSSSARIADVKKGLVTAYGKGKTNITAEYGDQKVTIAVEVDVIERMEISESALSLKSGDTIDLTLNVMLSDGSTRDVTSAAEWKTNSYKVATVSKGKVKAIDYGKAKITVKYGSKSESVPVDVDTLKYLQTDEVSLTLKKGQTVKITAEATYADGSEADVSKPAMWTSSRITVASVKDGTIRATGKGKATITVSFAGKKSKVSLVVTE